MFGILVETEISKIVVDLCVEMFLSNMYFKHKLGQKN